MFQAPVAPVTAVRNAGMCRKTELAVCLQLCWLIFETGFLVSLEAASMPKGSSACHLLCVWESEGLGLIIFFFAVVDVASID